MALVAYGSDISDSEQEDDEQDQPLPTLKPAATKQEPDKSHHLFTQLPTPKPSKELYPEEEDDEFLKKKPLPEQLPQKPPPITKAERKPAKIMLPSLSDFDDVEDMPTVKLKPSSKGSGLLNLLPLPRTGATIKSKPLIPNAVANRINKPVVKPPPQKPPPQKQKAQEKPNASSDESDGEESTAQTVMDFFSLNEPPPPIEDYAPVEDIPIHKKIVDEPNPYEHLTDEQLAEYQDEPQDPCPSSSQNETVEINNEVLRKLGGIRGRHKGEDIQIVDIDQNEILPDRREWWTKALTEENTSTHVSLGKRGAEGDPSGVQRRKHQITYLAHQAKVNEKALQNQWANNRLTRKQTQSKYGF